MTRTTRTSAPTPRPARLGSAEISIAIPKLRRRLSELENVHSGPISNISDQTDSIVTKTNSTLTEIFGNDTTEYESYHLEQAMFLPNFYPVQDQYRVEKFSRGLQSSKTKIATAIEVLEERLADLNGLPPSEAAAATVTATDKTKIFIVHGHDDAAREETARFVAKAGLGPIILHEQASGGRTVIEKLEHYSDVGFAVVLLTPDDVGGPANGDMKPRARQNVIAELFYFLGKLGRSRVCALRKGDVEIPSDIGGVVYVPLDDRGAWKTDLLRELEAAGYVVDWAGALR